MIIGRIALVFILFGCADLTPKAGQLECESISDCPPHWMCGGDLLCYPPDADSGDICLSDSDSSTDTLCDTGADGDTDTDTDADTDTDSDTDSDSDVDTDTDTDADSDHDAGDIDADAGEDTLDRPNLPHLTSGDAVDR
jgi:hypothetical protein